LYQVVFILKLTVSKKYLQRHPRVCQASNAWEHWAASDASEGRVPEEHVKVFTNRAMEGMIQTCIGFFNSGRIVTIILNQHGTAANAGLIILWFLWPATLWYLLLSNQTTS